MRSAKGICAHWIQLIVITTTTWSVLTCNTGIATISPLLTEVTSAANIKMSALKLNYSSIPGISTLLENKYFNCGFIMQKQIKI